MMVQVDHSATSLLGKAPGLLSLRVCGGSLNGQVVRLRSSKCSLGSGPLCTLRLQAPGVDPLHCLILRGARGTIVRRFALGTRLNGATFIDAPLRSGDRLSLGPVELKVLDDGRSQKEETSVEDFASEAEDSASIAQDVIGREQHDQAVEGLRAQTQQTRIRTRRVVEALRTSRKRIAELEALDTQGESQRARDAEQRRQLEQGRAIERTELACRLEELSRELQKNVSEKQTSQRQVALLQAELNRSVSEAEQQQSDIQEAERQKWEAEQAIAEAQLKQIQSEIEAQRRGLLQQHEQWQAECSADQARLSEGLTALEEERSELGKQRNEWSENSRLNAEEVAKSIQEAVAEAEALVEDRRRLEAEREEFRLQCDQQPEALELQRQAWQAECQQWKDDQTEQERLLEQHLLELNEQRSLLEQSQLELDAQLTLEAQRLESSESENDSLHGAPPQDGDASTENHESQLTDWYRQQEQVQERRALDSEAALEDSPPDDAVEVSESLQLDTSEQESSPVGSSLWEEEALGDVSGQDEVSIPQTAAEIIFEPVAEEPGPISSVMPSGNEEEESIENYMAKLLQRVHGQSSAPVMRETVLGMQEGRQTPAVITKVVSTPQPIEQDDSIAEPPPKLLRERVEPFVMKPRVLPPELASSLAAMRQLANSSARKAIDHSMQQRWLHAAIGKLIVCTAGLISGLILLAWTPDYSGVTFLASLVGFLIAVFWGLQSAMIFRNLLTTPCEDDGDTQDAASAKLLETPAGPVQEPAIETETLIAKEESNLSENDQVGQAVLDDELE